MAGRKKGPDGPLGSIASYASAPQQSAPGADGCTVNAREGPKQPRALAGRSDNRPALRTEASNSTNPESLPATDKRPRAGETAHPDAVYDFAQRLRIAQRGRPRHCCRRRCSAQPVQLQRGSGGRVQFVGVETCSSVWSCPICGRKICAKRGAEVVQFVEWAQTQGLIVLMLTLTVRHAAQHSLQKLILGVRAAWRAWWSSGRASQRRREALGIVHYVKALETTHGDHGWHPHQHALLAVKARPHDLTLVEAEAAWTAYVVKHLGEQCRPETGIGLKLTEIRQDDSGAYITKLGLEIAAIASKRGRRSGSRTSWQIADDAARRDQASIQLWREYGDALKGSRQLTWSRGTKDAAGIGELTDEQIAAEREERPEVLVIVPSTWDAMIRAGVLPIVVGLAHVGMSTLMKWLAKHFPKRGRDRRRAYGYHLLPPR